MEKQENNQPTEKKKYPLTPKGVKWYIGSVIAVVIGLYFLAAYQTEAFPDRVIDGRQSFSYLQSMTYGRLTGAICQG